jgi:hypothetical protein
MLDSTLAHFRRRKKANPFEYSITVAQQGKWMLSQAVRRGHAVKGIVADREELLM